MPEAIGAGPTRPKRSRKDEKVSKSEVKKKKKNEKKVKAEVEDGEKSEGEETLVMGGDGDDDAEAGEGNYIGWVASGLTRKNKPTQYSMNQCLSMSKISRQQSNHVKSQFCCRMTSGIIHCPVETSNFVK